MNYYLTTSRRTKKFLFRLSLIILFFISKNINAQDFAKMTFLDKRICDLGSFPIKDTVLVKRIHFTNNSINLLEIHTVYKSCSCTNVSLSKDKILPDEVAYVDISVDTKNKIGSQEIVVHLIANTEMKDHIIRLIFNIE